MGVQPPGCARARPGGVLTLARRPLCAPMPARRASNKLAPACMGYFRRLHPSACRPALAPCSLRPGGLPARPGLGCRLAACTAGSPRRRGLACRAPCIEKVQPPAG